MTWDEYHEQDHVEGFLDYLADSYDFVDVEIIGESYEGRPMRVIKVNPTDFWKSFKSFILATKKSE